MDSRSTFKETYGLHLISRIESIDYYDGFNENLISITHDFIARESYWAPGIPFDLFSEALKNSWNYSAFEGQRLIGFARLVTDYATFAYLSDVFVLAEFRGQGVGKNLLNTIFSQKKMHHLRRIVLATQDAHDLYKKYGFSSLKQPDSLMEIYRPAIELYKK